MKYYNEIFESSRVSRFITKKAHSLQLLSQQWAHLKLYKIPKNKKDVSSEALPPHIGVLNMELFLGRRGRFKGLDVRKIRVSQIQLFV